MGLNKIIHKTKFEMQCIISNVNPLIHQVIANVNPPEIIYKGIYKAPKTSPNIPLTDAHRNRFLLLDILRITITVITKISQMYKYPIDQKPSPYIVISRRIYTVSGHRALIPKTIVYDINSSDTGSTLGSDDIINFETNKSVPNSPYKQISLILTFISFSQPINNVIIVVMWYKTVTTVFNTILKQSVIATAICTII
jgi:hypothetical protein